MLSRKKYSEFTLGTAQLGMNYGVANATGKPDYSEAISIIRNAVANGVTCIDTARVYGDAEARIGEALAGGLADRVNVVTKVNILDSFNSDELEKNVRLAVDASIFSSCKYLGTQKLQTLLIHKWTHRFAYKEAIWRRILELKEEGYIKTPGVSLYTPKEAIEALNDPTIGHIQLPFNVLDWRWKAAGIDQLSLERKDVVIHARSALLQGLLVADSLTGKRVAANSATNWIEELDKLVKELRRENRADLCFAYVRAQSWITSTVVGVETLSQLDENIKLFQNPSLTEDECQRLEAKLGGATEELLNPSQWKIN